MYRMLPRGDCLSLGIDKLSEQRSDRLHLHTHLEHKEVWHAVHKPVIGRQTGRLCIRKIWEGHRFRMSQVVGRLEV